MKVAVNCAIATRGISGSATGMWHLVQALESADEVQLRLLWPTFRRRQSRLWNGLTQMDWDMRGAARAAGGDDVLVSPCNVGRARRGQRHLLVLHDTRIVEEPQYNDALFAAYARVLFGMSVRGADAVLVPSAHTAARARELWPGAEPIVAPWPVRLRPRAVDAWSGVQPTVLMVGETAAHKRHVLGIEAVAQARRLSGSDLRLLIVGPKGNAEADVAARSAGAGWITRIVDAAPEALERLYREAWVLLHTSRHEGYGLPVAEAAGLGVATVHSGYEALAEIAPGAVPEPDVAASYAQALVALLDAGAYAAAVDAGYRRARRLSAAAFRETVGEALRSLS